MNITRRQHYVWKHYLRAWEVNGLVSVIQRGGKSFRANPVNLAVAKDFYRLPRLQPEDVDFFRRMISAMPMSQAAKDLAWGWLEAPGLVAAARREFSADGVLTPEVEKALSEFDIEADERYHSAIEGNAVHLLDALRQGDATFWSSNEAETISFSYFIALQHMRTRRMSERVLADAASDSERAALAQRWPIMRHIFAANVGMTLFVERADWRLRLLEVGGEVDLITADQPVMNLLDATERNALALYYPVSPRRAVLIEHRQNESTAGGDILSDAEVAELNRRLFTFAHDQAFGRDVGYLKTLEKQAL